ncbi:MAG: hypothetical protein ACJAXI_003211, partial [Crocinitomicaceae bacterium]
RRVLHRDQHQHQRRAQRQDPRQPRDQRLGLQHLSPAQEEDKN